VIFAAFLVEAAPSQVRCTAVSLGYNICQGVIGGLSDDWTRINNSEVARRAISRIEARGKGILLLHDIHPRTVLALPEILNEFKSRGYKIVHVVPAAADRPKTATSRPNVPQGNDDA
jgi:peptidoglycan/xylan/chitin deacetylase (PgdA/CDA1 family)